MNPPEFADLRATPDRLSPFVESTGGGTAWLEDGVLLPENPAGRNAVGRGGCMQRNDAYAVSGLVEVSLPAMLLLPRSWGPRGRLVARGSLSVSRVYSNRIGASISRSIKPAASFSWRVRYVMNSILSCRGGGETQ